MSSITRISKMTITPEMAKKWLETSKGNRGLSKNSIEQIRHDILAGRWDEDSWDCITFDASGSLINGHHRLHAIVSAGKAVSAFVMFGKQDIRGDATRRRSLKDYYTMTNARGETNHKYICIVDAAVRIIMAFKYTLGTFTNYIHVTASLSDQERDAFIIEHEEELSLAVELVRPSMNRQHFLIPAHVAAVWILLKMNEEVEGIRSFYEQVIDKINVQKDSGSYALIRKMEYLKKKKINPNTKTELFFSIFKAYGIQKRGTKISHLVISDADKKIFSQYYKYI